MKREEKIEVTKPEDIKLLPKEEQMKWELALDMDLFDKVVKTGWRSLTAKESGKIGGIISAKRHKK